MGLFSKGRIEIRGARARHLKNLSFDIPRGALVAVAGPSGSGKSTLVFEVLRREAERRFIDPMFAGTSLRGILDRPDVDDVRGLSFPVAITPSRLEAPMATVAGFVGTYDYLRLLFAQLGRPHCLQCGAELVRASPRDIVAVALQYPEGETVEILAPLEHGRDVPLSKTAERLRAQGFVRLRTSEGYIDIGSAELPEEIDDPDFSSETYLVVDKLKIRPAARGRLKEGVDLALAMGDGSLVLYRSALPPEDGMKTFSTRVFCARCKLEQQRFTPLAYSYYRKAGACETCAGRGSIRELREGQLWNPGAGVSVAEAILPWQVPQLRPNETACSELFSATEVDPDEGSTALQPQQLTRLLFGNGDRRLLPQSDGLLSIKEWMRRILESKGGRRRKESLVRFTEEIPCPTCRGARVLAFAAARRLAGKSFGEVFGAPASEILEWLDVVAEDETFKAAIDEESQEEAGVVLPAVISGLRAVYENLSLLGVGYLESNRSIRTLSDGEQQRCHIARELDSGLTGVLYLMEEPTGGLHRSDISRLLSALRRLTAKGDSVILTEHNPQLLKAVDYLIELGPEGGSRGGHLLAADTPAKLAAGSTPTAPYLRDDSGDAKHSRKSRKGGDYLELTGVRKHNLKNISVRIPKNCFTVCTGISGSGKSSLVIDCLLPALKWAIEARRLKIPQASIRYERFGLKELKGAETYAAAVEVGGKEGARGMRSITATLAGLMQPLRELYAKTADARVYGFSARYFSFNTSEGACTNCKGTGRVLVPRGRLDPGVLACPECDGKRYRAQVLNVRYRQRSIWETLNLSVEQALAEFSPIPALQAPLALLTSFGLGYLQLAELSSSLSAGELQRVALASELCREKKGATLYVFDEPTKGLHPSEVKLLLRIIENLVEAGNTVLVVEHNEQLISAADFEIKLGPGAGEEGGYLLYE